MLAKGSFSKDWYQLSRTHMLSICVCVCVFFPTEVEVPTDGQVVETAVCVCGVTLGLIGVVTGLWLIMKANKSCQA